MLFLFLPLLPVGFGSAGASNGERITGDGVFSVLSREALASPVSAAASPVAGGGNGCWVILFLTSSFAASFKNFHFK